MSFDDLDRRRLAWCLVVNGLPYRFCSTVAPGNDLNAGLLYDFDDVNVQFPVDVVDAVLDVGPIEGHVDDLKAVAGQSPVEVQIRAWDARTAAGARVNPVETLLRVAGPSSSTFFARLVGDLEHDPAQTDVAAIQIDRSAAALTFPRAFHVGQEVLWADDYSDAGGHFLIDCTRAADRWVTQEHHTDAQRGEQPWVTSDVTTWAGRRADIWVSALDGSGAALGWDRYWSGLIDSPPTYNGRALTLRIGPLTAVMAYKLGVGSAARTASSVANAHWFRTGANGIADRISAAVTWDFTLAAFMVASANGALGTITLTADAAAMLDTMGHAEGFTFTYESSAGNVSAVPTGYATPVLSFGAAAAIAVAVAAGPANTYITVSGEFRETLPIRLLDPGDGDDQVVGWPGVLIEAINRAQTWQPGAVDSWADPDGEGGDGRLARMELGRNRDGEWVLFARCVDFGGVNVANFPRGRIALAKGGRNLRAGWIFGEGVATVRGDRAQGPGNWPINEDVWHRTELGQRPHAFAHDGPAVWFYQAGEPYVGPFDANIWTGGEQQIEITGSGEPVRMWISGSTSDTHPETGDTVYWFTAARPDRSVNVVQMESDSPLTAQVVAAAIDTTPGEYLRQLLTSGIGNGDNGTADVMPIGANLPEAIIRGSEFSGLAVPPPLDGQDYEAARGKSLTEQTQGLLMACGVQVAQVYSTGLDMWRIEPVHLGPPMASESVLTLTDDDLMVVDGQDPVRTEIDGRSVRAYVVRMNFRSGTDGEPEEIAVACNTERNDAGANSGEPVTLDLPGVEVASAGGREQAAAEVVADLRARVGAPRIRWHVTIRADMPGALELGLGSVVTLTSIYAIGIDPTTRAVETICRVMGMRRDLQDNRLDLELRPYPGSVGGWAQSARVATAPTGSSVTVEAAAFSDDDASFFSAGDKVSAFSPGAWSARVSLTILTVSGVTVTFTGAHGGLVAGDLLRAEDYTTAVASQRTQAYLADADGELGASDDGRLIG